MDYTVEITELAAQAIRALKDRRTQGAIYRRILALEENAHLQGAGLVGDLKGYRSVRSGGQRYRILYRVVEAERLAVVAFVGIRRQGHKRDVYAIAERLVRRGFL